MKAFLIFSLMVSAVSFSVSTEAAVSVGGTRVIFDGGKKEASITVSNSSKGAPVLIQSWVDEGEGSKSKAPFIITPPLFRLEPGQDNILRIVRTGGKLPEDRESLYWLNIKSIPSVKKNEVQTNTLQLAIKNRLKFIYRPGTIQSVPEESADSLIWKKNGDQIQVTNPTPFYMNFGVVKIGGKTVKPTLSEQTYVAPKSEMSFAIPAGATGNTVSWQIISDYGSVGKTFSAKY
ncbi:MAG: fimbrial biogenesis chaperone [Citrobacter telavivensis]